MCAQEGGQGAEAVTEPLQESGGVSLSAGSVVAGRCSSCPGKEGRGHSVAQEALGGPSHLWVQTSLFIVPWATDAKEPDHLWAGAHPSPLSGEALEVMASMCLLSS